MPKKATTQVQTDPLEAPVDQRLLKSIVRAHAWLDELSGGRHTSIKNLAVTADLHPKVVRQGLRLAFLAPDLMRNALDGNALLKLNQIPKLLQLCWDEQRELLG